jgi:hypothetical protein
MYMHKNINIPALFDPGPFIIVPTSATGISV